MATNTPLCSWGCSFPPWAARARAVLVLVNQAPSQATARALHPVCKGLEGQWISQAPSKANSLPGVRAFRSSNVLCYSPEQISRLLFFHLLSCLPFVKSTRTLSHWQKEEGLRCIAVSCNKLHWLVFSLFLPHPFCFSYNWFWDQACNHNSFTVSQQGLNYPREKGLGKTLWFIWFYTSSTHHFSVTGAASGKSESRLGTINQVTPFGFGHGGIPTLASFTLPVCSFEIIKWLH